MLAIQDKDLLGDDYNPHHNYRVNPYQVINENLDDDGSILEFNNSSSGRTISSFDTNSHLTASHQASLAPNENILKHSVSDDDFLYYDNERHDADDDDTKQPDLKMSTLKLMDSTSATLYSQRDKPKKERRDRAYSTVIMSNTSKYHHKYHSLKKKFKNQSSQLQFYQEKITNIQDDAEETEEKLRKEYEFKLLHLETKYLQEKSEKSSLQHENEKLRQQLFLQDQELKRTISGYSTATTINTISTTQPVPDSMPRASIVSLPTVLVSHSNSTVQSQKHPSSITSTPNSKSSPSPSSTSTSTATTSSSSSSSSSDEDSDSESSTSSDDDSDSDTDSDTDNDDEQDDEGDDSTENVINTVKKHDKKRRKKRRKIPKRLNRKIANDQPQGFWKTVWSLFGPPDVMCSCSDKR